MLKSRMKRRADPGSRAMKRLSQIEASIAALNNEDLLDFADIFRPDSRSPLAETASAEMEKRGISL